MSLAAPFGDDPAVVLPAEYRSRLWRVMPDSLALRLSRGSWQTAPHLALISYLIYLCASVGTFRRLLLNMPPGHGKHLAVGTPIRTPLGWTTMGDLHVGDLVYDEQGRPTRVTAVTEPEWKPCRNVVFDDGSSVTASDSHLWTTFDRDEARAYHNWRNRVAPDENDWPEDWTVWRTPRGIGANVRRTDQIDTRHDHRHVIPLARPLDAADVPLPLDPWVLGYWLGNGDRAGSCITTGGLGDERDHEAVLAQLARAGWTPNPPTTLDPRRSTFTTPGLAARLRAIGALGTKAVPDAYRFASPAQRLALLQGLMDSDGGYENSSRRVSFTSTDEHLADLVAELAVSLGERCTRDKRPAMLGGVQHGTAHRVSYSPTLDPFRLPRKANRLRDPGKQWTRHRVIVSAEPVGEQLVRCIQVDAPSATYLCGEALIPTHNTQLVLEWTPVWLLEHDPAARIIAITYGAELAEESGKNVRRLIDENADQLAIRLRTDSQAANRWRSTRGGGMWTAGIDGGITGRRAKGLLIDDPHKNFEDAHSAKARDRVWNFYRSTARNRLLPGGWIACVHTRWHESDLTGLLLEQQTLGGQQWLHVRFPAIAEEDETIETVLGEKTCTMLRAKGIPLPEWHRPEGRALWPQMDIEGERVQWYDEAELEDLKIDMGEYLWNGLYLQRPSSPTGSYFPVDKWEYVDEVPGRCRFTRFWDLAATEGGGDETVGALVAYDDENRGVYIVDIEAKRLSSAGVKKLVHLTAELDRKRYGRKVRQVLEQEPGASGKGFAEDYVTDVLAGFTVEAVPTTGDKEINAMPLASQQQVGNVYLVRKESSDADGRYEIADWWGPFIEQARAFPNGAHDDQVDAAAHAYQDLIRGRKRTRKTGLRTTAGAGQTGMPPGLPVRRAVGGL